MINNSSRRFDEKSKIDDYQDEISQQTEEDRLNTELNHAAWNYQFATNRVKFFYYAIACLLESYVDIGRWVVWEIQKTRGTGRIDG